MNKVDNKITKRRLFFIVIFSTSLCIAIGIIVLPWILLSLILTLDNLMPGSAVTNVYKSVMTSLIILAPLVTSISGAILGLIVGVVISFVVIKKLKK